MDSLDSCCCEDGIRSSTVGGTDGRPAAGKPLFLSFPTTRQLRTLSITRAKLAGFRSKKNSGTKSQKLQQTDQCEQFCIHREDRPKSEATVL